MLKLYYYLINYKLQSVADIFKTIDTMQKNNIKIGISNPKNIKKHKKGDREKFVA